jgi:hypothetical protein
MLERDSRIRMAAKHDAIAGITLHQNAKDSEGSL